MIFPICFFYFWLIEQTACLHVCVVAQSYLFAALWIVAHQVLLSMEFFQARILEWVAISYSKGSF